MSVLSNHENTYCMSHWSSVSLHENNCRMSDWSSTSFSVMSLKHWQLCNNQTPQMWCSSRQWRHTRQAAPHLWWILQAFIYIAGISPPLWFSTALSALRLLPLQANCFSLPVYCREHGQGEWQPLLLLLAAFLSLNLSCCPASFHSVEHFFNLFLYMHFYACKAQCPKQGLLSVSHFFLQFLKVFTLLTQNILSGVFPKPSQGCRCHSIGIGSSKVWCKSSWCLLVQQCQPVPAEDVRLHCLKCLFQSWLSFVKNNH